MQIIPPSHLLHADTKIPAIVLFTQIWLIVSLQVSIKNNKFINKINILLNLFFIIIIFFF